MKSQDVGLLFKLICLHRQEVGLAHQFEDSNWQDWALDGDSKQAPMQLEYLQTAKNCGEDLVGCYSVRALAHETGISKTQVSLALQRSIDVGLAKRDRKLNVPRANAKALFEFVVYGLRYVFPARPGAVTRGITTSLGAPVLQGKLISAGDLAPVWPDALGNTKGQSVEPLFNSVTYAVRRDADLYAFLALIDSIRIGQPRERNIAIELLQQRLEIAR